MKIANTPIEAGDVSSDSSSSAGNNAQPATTELDVPDGSDVIGEAGGTSTHALPAPVQDGALSESQHTDAQAQASLWQITSTVTEAPVPFSHISSEFEDGDKKLASQRTSSGPEVYEIVEVLIPSDNVAAVERDTKSAASTIESSNSMSYRTSVGQSTFSDTSPPNMQNGPRTSTSLPVSVHSVEETTTTELTLSTDISEENSLHTIQSRHWPVNDLSFHSLPRATLVEEQDDLIYEAVLTTKEQLPWFKKPKGQRLMLLFILGFLSAAIVVVLILGRSSNSGSGVSMQPFSCNTYHLIYRQALLDETQKFSHPFVDIDGDDAVVGSVLFGELFFFSNVLEKQPQSMTISSLEMRSTTSVSISGGFVVAGARDTFNEIDSGSAFVFEKDVQGIWTQALEISNVSVDDHEIAFDKDVLATIAADHDGSGSSIDIYRHVNTTWVKEARIVGPDLGYQTSVTVNGDFVAAGVPYYGVFVYEFDSLSKSWNQFNHPITSDDCGHLFGHSVILLEDNSLLISCPGIEGNLGAVYFYSQSDTEHYTFQQKIVASDGTPDDKFGHRDRLAADGNIMIVVTSHVYVYVKDGGVWTEVDKLPVPLKELEFDCLSVAISGKKALISSSINAYSFILQDC